MEGTREEGEFAGRNQGQKDKDFEEDEIKGQRETSATLRMCLLIECAASRSNKLGPTQSKRTSGQEAAAVHDGTWEASEKNPEGSAADGV